MSMGISLSEAQRIYIDYHCYNNSMHTSNETMGYIVHEYSDYIRQWQSTVSDDDNKYEFDDSDFENWKAEGEDAAKDKTGYEDDGWDEFDQYGNSINSAVAGGAGALYSHATGGVQALGDFAKGGVVDRWQSGNKISKESFQFKETKVSDIIAAGIAIATYGLYLAEKPNEEQVEACDDLLEQMEALQQALLEAQAMMQEMAQEIAEATDEAHAVNEEANENMDTEKTEFDMFVDSYSALVEKAKTEGLTKEERALIEDLFSAMAAANENINTTGDDAQTTVGDIYSGLETYQDGYDDAAQEMGNALGVTDYAEEFDERTQTLCQVAALGQAGNAASGAMSGAKLIMKGASKGWFGLGEIILGAAAIAAGVGSGFAAKEQYDMSNEVGVEIDARVGTQGLNDNTMGVYDEGVTNYEASMGDVENLELVVPDDIDAPDEEIPPETPTTNGSSSQGSNTTTQNGSNRNYRFIK